MSSLEQKIADALASNDIKSSDLAALIREAEAAAVAADEAAEQARARALDPRVVDPAARIAVQEAEFRSQRLKAALPQLRTRFTEVKGQEDIATWRVEYERVKEARDKLVTELLDVYPAAIARLIDLFVRIAACDEQVGRINGSPPYGARDRLRSVELEARGVNVLMQPEIDIAKELHLPAFPRAPNQPVLAWPPRQAPILPAMVMPVMPLHPGPNWAADVAARNQARREESARVANFYREQTKEQEARENAQVRAAAAERRGS